MPHPGDQFFSSTIPPILITVQESHYEEPETAVVARLASFQQELKSIAERAHNLDIQTYALVLTDPVANELRKKLLALISESLELLNDILTECDGAFENPGGASPADRAWYLPTAQQIDAILASDQGTRRTVAKIAVLVHTDLQRQRDQLGPGSPDSTGAQLLGDCDHLRKRIYKRLSALDRAIAAAEQTAPKLEYHLALQ